MNDHAGIPVPVVAAYYYPGWHRDPTRTIGGRRGGSEWDLLFERSARDAYPDVRRPLDGPVEPSVETLTEESRMAHAAGIDAFIWCWYWDHGKLLFAETLDMFLRSRLPDGFRYALMWVNKRPHYYLPISSRTHISILQRVIDTDERDFQRMIEHLADRHWCRPSYLVRDGRPVLLIFHGDFLVDRLGAERLRRLLRLGEQIADAAGFRGIEYVAMAHRLKHSSDDGSGGDRVPFGQLGFSAVSNYVYLPDWSGPAVQDYDALIRRRASEWTALGRLHELPVWPSVSPGWDGRPRGSVPAEAGYPWTPRIVGETPRGLARALRLWRQHAERARDVAVLPIASWNEWTEGHAIAPCDRHGDGMLRVVREFTTMLRRDQVDFGEAREQLQP